MIKDLIALDGTSKVWIFAADRFIEYDELEQLRERLFAYLDSWKSHGKELVTYGNIFHRRFLAVFVDESAHGASGCSIDSTTHFIESLGSEFGVDFFNRSKYYTMVEEEIIVYEDINSFKEAIAKGEISATTLVFDHTCLTKTSFLKNWIVPIEDTWMKKYIVSK